MSKLVFKIDGMCCMEEMAALKKALLPLLGGKEDRVTFDLISEKITVEQDSNLPSENDIIKAIQTTGMRATPWKTHIDKRQPSQTFWQRHGQATMTAASALGLAAGFLAHSIENSPSDALLSDEKEGNTYPPEVIAFYAASMLSGVWFILPKAFRSARKLRPDMNLLMTIAIGGAAGINQWFEASLASALFSSSLLLESWNINRARKSIGALVELTPSTAKVAEKKSSNTTTYIRQPVIGDCGYAAFELSREQALQLLIEAADSIKDIVKPAVQEGLLMESFYYYLSINSIITKDVTHQDIVENSEKYVTDINIIKGYLNYDIRDRHIDAGWSHPCVLQALAYIQQKELRLWQLNEQDMPTPLRTNQSEHTVYIPINTEAKIDILFVNRNQFEKLEFCENENFIESASTSTLDLDVNQRIFIEKPVEEIPVGSIIIVSPGEKIPMDSILIAGTAEVNQAPITGESMPVRKEMGDELFAGTINGDTTIFCQVTKIASDSTLSRIINMVEEAQSRRAHSEQFVEKFASYYTPLMMMLAVILIVLLPTAFDQSWEQAFYQALEILVISCPCALVVSTPISIVAGLNAAARAGVLIKGGMYLEAPAHLKAIALDKTGTLTSGEPTVQKILTLDEQSKHDLLKLALSLEEHSDHPLARAIRQKAKSEGIVADKPVENFRIFKGKGAEGYLDGKLFWIGSRRLLREKVGDLAPIALYDEIQNLENSGHSVVAIGYDQHVCGLIGISDSVRPESKEAIQALQQLGIENISMLTGDNRGSAKVIAELIGIENYQAELLPEDKVQQVESLVKKYHQVAMVGDGVNDAPAMATANLAIAMGAAGSDAAIETADIALMSDDLRKLSWLISHSRRTLGIIKQNVVISLSIKSLFMALALANKSTLGMAIAADMGASFIVVFNALRLLNNGLSLKWNRKNKAAPQQQPTVNYSDKRPLLLEQDMNETDEIELTIVGGTNNFFKEAKIEPASKKPGSCSKSKASTVTTGTNQPISLEQDTGEGTIATLTVVSGNNSFIDAVKVNNPVPKKACCSSSSGSCSKPKQPASASNNDSLLIATPGTNNKPELNVATGINSLFAEAKVESTPKKSCCSGGSCSKSKASAVTTGTNQPISLEQDTGESTKSTLAVISGNNTFIEAAKVNNPVPQKACCSSSGSCSKPKQLASASNNDASLIVAENDRDSNKIELKFA